MRQQAFALVAVLVLLSVGVAAISSEYETSVREGGDRTTIDNETFTADFNNATNLSESNVTDRVYFDNSSVAVYNQSSGEQLGSGYKWNEGGFGRVNVTSSATVSDGTTLNITYGYSTPTGSQETAETVAMLPADVGDALAYLLVMFVVFAALVRVAS